MAFPWDVLITAVSTLTAGLGGTELKQRGDRKERIAKASREDDQARAGRRRAAYADLVTAAGEMQLYYEQMIALRQRFTGEHGEVRARSRQGEETGRQFARAISMVQLVGSDAAREAARAVHNATVLSAGRWSRCKRSTARLHWPRAGRCSTPPAPSWMPCGPRPQRSLPGRIRCLHAGGGGPGWEAERLASDSNQAVAGRPDTSHRGILTSR